LAGGRCLSFPGDEAGPLKAADPPEAAPFPGKRRRRERTFPSASPGTRSGMEQGPFRKAGRNRFLSPFKELFRSKYNKFFKIVYTFL